MTERSNARLVYSTAGETCPRCGWPIAGCRCSVNDAREEAVPARIVAKLRLEKSGRGGKSVTVIDGLPENHTFLKDLCAELKRICGTGGAVKDGTIELQGEHRTRLRAYLAGKSYTVKG